MPAIDLLLTGSELMTGDVVDSNSSMIAQQLLELGIPIRKKVTIGDDLALLCEQIETLSQSARVLLINGGLGPTTDDLTAEGLALAAGDKVVEHPEARAHLEAWCAKRGFELSVPNLKQARLPQDCQIIPNPIGSAVGFHLTLNQCLIICTPGVPRELEGMMQASILPLILAHCDHLPRLRTRKFQVFGLGEARIQQCITQGITDWPENIILGYRAALPFIDVKLTASEEVSETELSARLDSVKALLGPHVIGDQGLSLSEILVQMLSERQEKMVTAESCTGGRIASQITRIAGASEVFDAGFVTYSNEMKIKVLGVQPGTLETEGAVSEAVVKEMAEGALRVTGAQLAIAVSGIAGPSGGTPEKPVGTVWIAWGRAKSLRTRQLMIPGNREFFQRITTLITLDLIRRELLGIQDDPQYFFDRKPRPTTPDVS